MRPITQETVLTAIPKDQPVSFLYLIHHFILDEERQYTRLERTLQKLHSQDKIEVVKEGGPTIVDIAFGPAEYREHGTALRYYKFKRN